MNSLPKTVIRERRDCDLNSGPTAAQSSTVTTRLPSQPWVLVGVLTASLCMKLRWSMVQ